MGLAPGGVYGLCALLAGCAIGPPAPSVDAAAPVAVHASAWAAQSRIDADAADWVPQTFGDRPPTHYQVVQQQGRWAVHAHSAAGNSSLRRAVALPPGQTAGQLRFSWWVPRLNDAADLRDSDIDDAVARVVLSFDGDRAARFGVRDHMLSELAQLVTGEPLPYATLVYVWDNRYPVGTVIANPHTARIRQLVVEKRVLAARALGGHRTRRAGRLPARLRRSRRPVAQRGPAQRHQQHRRHGGRLVRTGHARQRTPAVAGPGRTGVGAIKKPRPGPGQ